MVSFAWLESSRVAEYQAYVAAGEPPPRLVSLGNPLSTDAVAIDVGELKALAEDDEPGSPSRTRRLSTGIFELTFTAPARIGVEWGLAERHVGDSIDWAQDRSIDAAIGACRRVIGTFGYPRQKHDQKILVAAFRHHSTPFGEPSLHDHVLVVVPRSSRRPYQLLVLSAVFVFAFVIAVPVYMVWLRLSLRNIDGMADNQFPNQAHRHLAPPRWRWRRRPYQAAASTGGEKFMTIAQLRHLWRETAKLSM